MRRYLLGIVSSRGIRKLMGGIRSGLRIREDGGLK